ncbi:MAG: glutamate carboxypeptidase [Pseudonocardiales bacterium]|nr:MAG: glutamate carboxypeptidase [Pseudonocardiales bacterium]
MEESARLARLQDAQPAMLDDLRALVTCESPSSDPVATARCADVVAEIGLRLLRAAPERGEIDGRPHLIWRFGQRPTVLLLGHLDTVWPLGSLQRHPFAVGDGIVTGPGCYDMKAGLVQLLHALAVLPDRRGVTVLITSDEEIGSPSSRPLIEAEARLADAALVLEASGDGHAGALKTARKGVSVFWLHVTGLAAHAGLEPERGANAAVELAHQILAVAALGDADLQTSVTPSLAAAGTTTNTVPDRASVSIDVRAFTVAEQRRVAGALSALRPAVPGTSVRVEIGEQRPPLPPAASSALYERARLAATRLCLPPLTCVAVGGGSDGNVTAGVGTPTLDGLGAVGGGAHADDEHVLVGQLPVRAALLSELIEDLLFPPSGRWS